MLQTYDHYLYAAIAVLGTLAAVGLVAWLMHRSPWSGWIRSLQGVAGPFINIIGILFGLTLAFLANDTWSAHDQARGAVYREADAVRSVLALADTMPAVLRDRVRGAALAYARTSAAEWPRLARRDSDPAVTRAADALLGLAASREVLATAGAAVQARMLGDVVDARQSRDQRISLSQTHINPLKWLGMAFLGFLTLLSVAVVHSDNPRAAIVGIVIFALAAAPMSAIVLVQGNPFQPPAAVTPAPLTDLLGG
ncbi:MAG: DUF4239 domain-containing protein [Burkholderiaceae bacterium]|nr:DUF4239 domain-containing protein [Burkholderiaceae bacterium]